MKSIVRACNYHIRALRHVHWYLLDDVMATVGSAIMTTSVNYYNLLYNYLASNQLKCLERVQKILHGLSYTITSRKCRCHLAAVALITCQNKNCMLVCSAHHKVLTLVDTTSYLHDVLIKCELRRTIQSSQYDLYMALNFRLSLDLN